VINVSGRALERALTRVRRAWFAIAQCALAASGAWAVAGTLLHHPRPFFAPIAAVVCLGLSDTQRLRRMIELAFGVSIGVGVAELLVNQIGNGWWQIGLVVLLGMSLAQLFGGGSLMSNQAALQAIFLTALPSSAGQGLFRWEDALIGGASALLVVALLPADPSRTVRQQARDLIDVLTEISAQSAAALRSGDVARADAALDKARHTQKDIEAWTNALRGGEEISRISPLRRRRRPELVRYRRALVGLDLATRNLRVAVRRIVNALETDAQMPAEIADLFDHLAEVLRTLRSEVGTADRLNSTAALAALAKRLDPAALEPTSLPANVVVAQLRSVVVDLLEATGTDPRQARAMLPG